MDGKYITNTSQETFELGSKFADLLKAGDSLLLIGELGTGKTTFTQGLAKGLGISERILSPTFVLQRLHKVHGKDIKILNHIDLYRLEGIQAIGTLGLTETIEDPEGVTIIEWADRLSDLNQQQGYRLEFKYIDENKREINIIKNE